MQTSRFLLSGNASYHNRGCEGIVRGTAEMLRRQFGECWFISNYYCPPNCTDAQNETDDHIIHRPFPAFPRNSIQWWENRLARKFFGREGRMSIASTERTFASILASESITAILMVGGDNYSFDYGPPDRFFRLNEIALEQGLPSVIWGASVGPFTSDPDYERKAAAALQQVTMIAARESETIDYLNSIGVRDNVIYSADPAFYLEPTPCALPAEMEAVLSQGCIGLNLSPLLQKYFLDHENPFEAWIASAARLINSLADQFDMPILLIPHVMYRVVSRNKYANNDHLLLSRAAELVDKPEQVHIMGPNYNAAQSKWIIGRVKLFAGARTHATIAAISSNVPTICIGYSMKARGIAQDVYGNLDWLIDGQDLVLDEMVLTRRVMKLLQQESSVRTHLAQMNPILKQRAQQVVLALEEITRNP